MPSLPFLSFAFHFSGGPHEGSARMNNKAQACFLLNRQDRPIASAVQCRRRSAFVPMDEESFGNFSVNKAKTALMKQHNPS
jgi:hypothetical protein